MILAFLDSIKYSGHLLPMVFLRVYLGNYYLLQGLSQYRGDFLNRPRLAEQISEFLPLSSAPEWYKFFLITWGVPHWQSLAFFVTGMNFVIAASYLVGYVVRPVALIAAILSLQMYYISL
jgi:thiosulfate dehydrogenase [quinone] large subunit